MLISVRVRNIYSALKISIFINILYFFKGKVKAYMKIFCTGICSEIVIMICPKEITYTAFRVIRFKRISVYRNSIRINSYLKLCRAVIFAASVYPFRNINSSPVLSFIITKLAVFCNRPNAPVICVSSVFILTVIRCTLKTVK